MRALAWAAVGAVLLLARAGCGTGAETSSTGASEAPDAVATGATESPSPSLDANSTDAKVPVDGAGFSLGDYEQVGYGLVLKNTSTSMDAEELQVTVSLLDKSGAVVQTENTTLSLIPAGDTWYFGGMLMVNKGDKPRQMEAFVDVGASEAAQYKLPTVTNVRVVKDQFMGVSVKGQVKNEWKDAALSTNARIDRVLFDANDQVVGGGFGYLNSNLPPAERSLSQVRPIMLSRLRSPLRAFGICPSRRRCPSYSRRSRQPMSTTCFSSHCPAPDRA